MTLKLRLYSPDDYPMVSDWWRAWRWDVLPQGYLPKLGVIASDENNDICAAWLYRTDSDFALVEWFISNPKAKKNRKEAIALAAGFLCDAAKEQGFKAVIVMVKNQHLIKNLKGLGFVGEQDGMTNMIKGL